MMRHKAGCPISRFCDVGIREANRTPVELQKPVLPKEPQSNSMNKITLLELLAQVQSGALTPTAATERLATLPYEDLGHARIDHHRTLRTGLPEVIYAQGKSPEQTTEIFTRMAASGTDVLATRADAPTAAMVLASIPAAIHHPQARAITLKQSPATDPTGQIAILAAGTSDQPAA